MCLIVVGINPGKYSDMYRLTQQRVKDSAHYKTVHVLVPRYRKINCAGSIRQAVTRLFAFCYVTFENRVCCDRYSYERLEFC